MKELTLELNGLQTELEWTRDRESEAREAAEETRETLQQMQSNGEEREREGER